MSTEELGSQHFGTLLRQLRERARLTQEQLAEKASLSTNAISALERGERRRPYPHTVRALVAALGLNAEDRLALQARVPRRDQQREPSIPLAPSSPGSATLPVPRQLPAVPRDFTGRMTDLARLDALVPAGLAPEFSSADVDSGADQTATRTVVISAINGTAGVGKTTLAVAWAHRVCTLFSDGQLYVNLRGYDPGPPATPGEVLDGFLRALNVPATMIPPTVPERAALFRSLVAGRRILVLLDNANSAEQVRPLLPGSASCLVVVTSRVSLTGLAISAGAVRINLDLLPSDDAVALLRAIIGPERADLEPEAVAELARLCARLPLALHLAGQRAAARPGIRLADVVAELADQSQRLELFSAGNDEFTAVRSVFSWSYRSLPENQARMFRLLGLHPGPDISIHAAAALANTSPAQTRCLLDGLADAHLVEHVGLDRFGFHDLLRAYAREQAKAGHPQQCLREAGRRLLGHYLHAAAAADHQLHPGRQRTLVDATPPPDHPVTFASYEDALAWCETERANLMTVTGAAAEFGLHATAWQLPNNLWSFFFLRKYWADWIRAYRIGLNAARRSGDPHGQARMLSGLATAYTGRRRFDEALDYHHRALRLFREAGDRWGEGSALVNLGDTYLGLRRFDESADHSAQALAIFHEIGNEYIQGIALGNLGEAYLGLHRYDQALANFLQVLELCRQINHRHGEGLTLIHLGEACLGLRRYNEALDYLVQAFEMSRDTGDRHGEALALNTLGQVYEVIDRPDLARRHREAALLIFDNLGDPQADELRARLQVCTDPQV